MPCIGSQLTAKTVLCDELVTGDLKYDTSSFSGWMRHTGAGIFPIEIEAGGMKTSSATPVDASLAADFGAASFGTVTVINDGSTDLSSSKHYLVQVKTTKMVNKECPVMVSQVVPASEFDSGAGTFTGDWRHMTSMACGSIPCDANSANHFNVWFKPNETIKAGSKFWFNWWIPQTAAPGFAAATGPVNATLPTVP